MSVVILVTKPDVENLSMLENEKVCIFSYIASLKLQAKPVDASAAYFPAKAPNSKLNIAITSISPP